MDITYLHTVMEIVQDGLFLMDDKFFIRSLNASATRMFGYAPEDVTGKHIKLLLAAPYNKKHESYSADYYDKSMPNKAGNVWHIEAKCKDGRLLPVELRIDKIHVGQETMYVGNIHDLSLQRHQEEQIRSALDALKTSEDRYKLAIEGLSVGIWDWKIPKGELFWSDRGRKIMHIEGEINNIYTMWEERLHPEDKEATLKMLFGHLNQRIPYDVEYRLLRDDGHYVWIHAKGKAVWNKDGKPLRMVGSIEDITWRKESESRTKDEASRLQAVMNTVLDGLITINSRGIIQSFNPSSSRIFGYKPEEVIGKNVKMLMPEPDQGRHDSYIGNYHKTGIAKIIGIGREVEAKRKDGSIFPMELGISSFEINGERCFVGIIRDITERKLLESLRRSLLDKLIASNTELERFAYIASHDMQEPIRMVTNFSEIIAKEYGEQLDERGHEYLNLVIDSGKRMRDLVEDLLDYSRLDSEGIRTVEFQGDESIDGALKNLQELIREKGATVTYDSLPDLCANPIQFMRLLQNLIANAIKYQPPGNKPAIHVNGKESQDGWTISVKDNGLGIKPEFIEQIFQPFRRLHRWEVIQGSGLGLSICKKIIENHGGRIWVESSPGQGSTFSFFIPNTQLQHSEAA